MMKFNKNNYSNVDSIIFSPRFDTSPGKQTVVQFYNLTDDVVISNSKVVANNPEPANVDSDNIFDDLPDEEITLSMLVKNGTVWDNLTFF